MMTATFKRSFNSDQKHLVEHPVLFYAHLQPFRVGPKFKIIPLGDDVGEECKHHFVNWSEGHGSCFRRLVPLT